VSCLGVMVAPWLSFLVCMQRYKIRSTGFKVILINGAYLYRLVKTIQTGKTYMAMGVSGMKNLTHQDVLLMVLIGMVDKV